VASSDFPNDICGVVLQENKDGCQFSWWCDGKSDYPKEHNSLRTSKAIAKLMLEEGEYISVVGENATHYHNDEVYPYWADHLQRIRRIGKHIFYKEKSEEWLRPLARPYNLFK
jgi:spore germination cell wall hydrolase CwlJ-like protein|tara:strand:- start:532 stop:870 length:339 start_codon:yes stop_codon:yes gene_type:complete